MRTWWRGFVSHLERDAFFGNAFFLLLGQHRASDEVTFVERHKKTQAGFDRGCLLVQLLSVKRITHLGSQRVARAEPARFQAERTADLEELVPDRDDLERSKYFKTIFAGVAGAGDVNDHAVEVEKSQFVFLEIARLVHLGRPG